MPLSPQLELFCVAPDATVHSAFQRAPARARPVHSTPQGPRTTSLHGHLKTIRGTLAPGAHAHRAAPHTRAPGQEPLACESPAEASHGALGARGEGEGPLLRKALPGRLPKAGDPRPRQGALWRSGAEALALSSAHVLRTR